MPNRPSNHSVQLWLIPNCRLGGGEKIAEAFSAKIYAAPITHGKTIAPLLVRALGAGVGGHRARVRRSGVGAGACAQSVKPGAVAAGNCGSRRVSAFAGRGFF